MPTKEAVAKALAVDDTAQEGRLSEELFTACAAGDSTKVAALLEQGADARHQREDTGRGALMEAARGGHLPVVQQLLAHGVPWNAQDKEERSAGDHAVECGHTQARRFSVERTTVVNQAATRCSLHRSSRCSRCPCCLAARLLTLYLQKNEHGAFGTRAGRR